MLIIFYRQAAIWKNDQWVCLTRMHAEAVDRLPRALGVDLVGLLGRTRAPDELYYPICLALLGELPCVDEAIELGAPNDGTSASFAPHILGQRVTYCDWSGNSAKSPATLTWSDEVVAAVASEGCLLSRKFAAGTVPAEAWGSAVLKEDDFEVSQRSLRAAAEDTDTQPHHAEERREHCDRSPERNSRKRSRSRSRSRDRDASRSRGRSRSRSWGT